MCARVPVQTTRAGFCCEGDLLGARHMGRTVTIMHRDEEMPSWLHEASCELFGPAYCRHDARRRVEIIDHKQSARGQQSARRISNSHTDKVQHLRTTSMVRRVTIEKQERWPRVPTDSLVRASFKSQRKTSSQPIRELRPAAEEGPTRWSTLEVLIEQHAEGVLKVATRGLRGKRRKRARVRALQLTAQRFKERMQTLG